MSGRIPQYQIIQTKAIDDSTRDITAHTQAVNVNLSISSKEKSATKSYEIYLPVKEFTGDQFGYKDKFEIKMGYTSPSTVIKGPVQDVAMVVHKGQRRWRVLGTDYSILLNNVTLWGSNAVFESGVKPDLGGGDYLYNSGKVVKHLITSFAPSLTTNNIVVTQPTDNSNEQWTYASFNFRRLGDVINELCTHEYTEEGDYTFWVDKDEDVHYVKKSNTVGKSLEEGVNLINADYQLKTWDKKNWIIVYCGRDHDGQSMYSVGYNSKSIDEIGRKMAFYSKPNFWADVAQNYSGTKTVGEMRDMTKVNARNWASKIADTNGKPHWRVKAQVRGSDSWTVGNIIPCTFKSTGWNQKELRLKQVRHKFDSKGWRTILTLEQEAVGGVQIGR